MKDRLRWFKVSVRGVEHHQASALNIVLHDKPRMLGLTSLPLKSRCASRYVQMPYCHRHMNFELLQMINDCG